VPRTQIEAEAIFAEMRKEALEVHLQAEGLEEIKVYNAVYLLFNICHFILINFS
jgi:hypothetical protein